MLPRSAKWGMNKKLKVLVYGAGAVGSTAGGFLSKDHEVTLLGRKKHLDAIRRTGLEISGIWGNFHFKKFTYETSASALIRKKPRYDLILVTVKSYDTAQAAKDISRLLGPKTLVLNLQNGIGNAEILRRRIPASRILSARVIFGTAMPEPGHIRITVMAEPTAIGEAFKKKLTPRVSEIVKVFSKAGFPSAAAPDVRSVLWAKVIYNCALNPLASLRNCHYGFLTEKQGTRDMMDRVIDEIYAVAKKAGVALTPPGAESYRRLFYSRLVARTYNHRPSMLQDLENGKQTEIEALSGEIARLGKRFRVETPMNAALARAIRVKEKTGL